MIVEIIFRGPLVSRGFFTLVCQQRRLSDRTRFRHLRQTRRKKKSPSGREYVAAMSVEDDANGSGTKDRKAELSEDPQEVATKTVVNDLTKR